MKYPAAFLALAPLLAACASAQEPAARPVASADVTGTLFVANKRGASLSRIDLASGEETHRVETCENPHELTVSPDQSTVTVACYSGRSLESFSTADLGGKREVELGEGARVHTALAVTDSRLVAGAEGRGSLYVVDFASNGTYQLAEIGGGGPGAHLLAVGPDGRDVWGTIIPSGTVVRYRLDDEGGVEVLRRRIGEQIEAIALAPDASSLWVSSNAANTAYRLNPETLAVEAEVATGEVPIRLAMHPSGKYLVSSNFGGGDLSVIDTVTNEVVRTISVSGTREAVQVTLVFSPDGERLYAAETGTDTIAEVDFDTGRVLRRIATGPGGDGLAISR